MSKNQGYDYISGTWTCDKCGLLNLEETSITSLVRVYEPELSYHMNVTCIKCKTIFSIMLQESEYMNIADYDKTLG